VGHKPFFSERKDGSYYLAVSHREKREERTVLEEQL